MPRAARQQTRWGSTNDVLAYLGISRSTLTVWQNATPPGEEPYVRVSSRMLRWDMDAVDSWMRRVAEWRASRGGTTGGESGPGAQRVIDITAGKRRTTRRRRASPDESSSASRRGGAGNLTSLLRDLPDS